MSTKAPMTIVTRKQLKKALNVPMNFIVDNHEALGGFGRERSYRYILEEAQAFILSLSRKNSQREKEEDNFINVLIRDIDTYIKTARSSQTGPREMVGKGGRMFSQSQDVKGCPCSDLKTSRREPCSVHQALGSPATSPGPDGGKQGEQR